MTKTNIKSSTVKNIMVFVVNSTQLVVADSIIEAIQTYNEAYPETDVIEVKRLSTSFGNDDNYKAIIKVKVN